MIRFHILDKEGKRCTVCGCDRCDTENFCPGQKQPQSPRFHTLDSEAYSGAKERVLESMRELPPNSSMLTQMSGSKAVLVVRYIKGSEKDAEEVERRLLELGYACVKQPDTVDLKLIRVSPNHMPASEELTEHERACVNLARREGISYSEADAMLTRKQEPAPERSHVCECCGRDFTSTLTDDQYYGLTKLCASCEF